MRTTGRTMDRRSFRTGPPSSVSAASPGSTCPARAPAWSRRRSGANELYEQAADPDSCGGTDRLFEPRLLRDRPALERRRQRQPRGRPGRPRRDAAAARRRLRGDRQRRRDRPAAPRRPRPRTPSGRPLQSSTRRRSARSTSRAETAQHDHGGPARGGDRARRHLLRGVRRLPDRRSPARPERRRRPIRSDQSWYAALAPATTTPRSSSWPRSSAADSAPTRRRPPRVRSSASTSTSTDGEIEDVGATATGLIRWSPTMSTTSRTQPQTFDERSAGFAERTGFLRIDPLIAFAGIGLIACSIVALASRRRTTSRRPLLLRDPPEHLRRRRDRADVRARPLRLLALPRASRRHLRGDDRSRSSRSSSLGAAGRGSQRWIDLPFFSFQPSELGKLLLVLALAGFVIDRARRQSEWQRTARLLLLGLVPAAIVFVQPDLGTALVYGAVTLAILFIAGSPLDALRCARRPRGRGGHDRPRRRARGRAADASGLPAGPAHVVPQSE